MSNINESLNNIGLKPKNLLITLIVVGVITGGNLWVHRNDAPLGTVQYSEFGFTFTHESGGYVFTGTDLGRTQSYTEGSYGVDFESEGFLEIGIYWFSDELVPVSADESILEANLDMKLEAWESIGESIGAQFSYDSNFVSSEKDGYDMIYALFELDFQDGIDETGIMGVWQCGERIFIMYIRYIEDYENSQTDILTLTEMWKRQLNQLKCH